MPLTKFDFLNRKWEAVKKSKDINLGRYQKADIRENLIAIGKDIEEVLNAEIQSDDRLNFLSWPFDRVWRELKYVSKFEEFKREFNEKLTNSIDPKRMIEEAIKQREIKELEHNELVWEKDRIPKGERLGYKLAVNGENPKVGYLMFNMGYHFDSDYYQSQFVKDNSEKILDQLYRVSFSDKFKSLHWVCQGFLRARIVYYLKQLNQEKREVAMPEASGIKQRIVWKGDLKEFAELIDQLEQKGWIEIQDREIKPTAETLSQVFDFSATKKRPESDTANSLSQYLKTSERVHKIYTKRYTKKFNSILPNTNQKVVTK
jgi:hypothetical protein